MSSSADPRENESAFYKRLVLLSSLHSIEKQRYYRIDRLRGPSQPSSKQRRNWTRNEKRDLRDDRELRAFLDRLAEICASKRDGSTVTAVTIHRPGPDQPPHYIFASNSRSDDPNAIKTHNQDVLGAFCSDGDGTSTYIPRQRRDVLMTYHEILGRILLFNRERLRVYLKSLWKCLQKLQDSLDGDKDPDETGASLSSRRVSSE